MGYGISADDLFGDNPGRTVVDRMYSDVDGNLSTSRASQGGGEPMGGSLYNLSEMLMGVPAADDPGNVAQRIESVLAASMSNFFGEIDGESWLAGIIPEDIQAILQIQSPPGEGPEDAETGPGGARGGSAEAQEVVALAKNEVGYQESPRGSNQTKFADIAGHTNGQLWCSTFVSAILTKAGHHQADLVTPSTVQTLNNFRDLDAVGTEPKVGAIVFFHFGRANNQEVDHNAIVKDWTDTELISIDGNTSGDNDSNGGQVAVRSRGYDVVKWFAYPEYEDEDEGVLDSTSNVVHNIGSLADLGGEAIAQSGDGLIPDLAGGAISQIGNAAETTGDAIDWAGEQWDDITDTVSDWFD